jgi:hypothetical protein
MLWFCNHQHHPTFFIPFHFGQLAQAESILVRQAVKVGWGCLVLEEMGCSGWMVLLGRLVRDISVSLSSATLLALRRRILDFKHSYM